MTGTSISPRVPVVRLPGVAALIAAVCVLAPAPGAQAATSRSPRATLVRLERRLHVRARTARTRSPRTATAGAAAALTRATAPELWMSGRETIAPAYGGTVFTGLSAALSDLRHVSGTTVRGDEALIAGAAQQVAATAVGQAAGGDPGMVGRARQALASARRLAARGAFGAAVGASERAWRDAFTALTQLVGDEITHVPVDALATAAENALGSRTIGLAGPRIMHTLRPLRRAGKPELFFVGAEGCPFCAVQRWGMVIALSQFGTFSRLQPDAVGPLRRPRDSARSRSRAPATGAPGCRSSPSRGLGNVRQGVGIYAAAQPPASERTLLERYDGPGQTPFIDVANRFNPGRLDGPAGADGRMSWPADRGRLGDPASIPAQAIGGEAEAVTAELCQVTGGNRQSVCASPIVGQYQTALPLAQRQGGRLPDRRGGDSGPRAGDRSGAAGPGTVCACMSR